MCNRGDSQHRFSVKDIVACSSKLQFVFLGPINYGSLLVFGFVNCRDFHFLFVFEV
jgi:hypothetical protein